MCIRRRNGVISPVVAVLAGVFCSTVLLPAGAQPATSERRYAVSPTPEPLRTRLSPLVVSATRAAASVDELPVTVDVFSAERLRSSPALTLDATLRESAAFSLFRRSSGLTANPTAQGVSLRGLGPSGASRSLVLLDGVPLNDPFGGWVAWNKIPRLALAGAEIVRGGGSGAWGNAALGGTVALFSRPPDDSQGALAATGGEFSTVQGEASLTQRLGNGGTVRMDAAAFSTDGFYTVGATQRGAIDRRLDSDYRLAQVTWQQPLGRRTTGTVTARGFSEERGNGTPLQRNSTREGFVSAGLQGRSAALPSWSAVLYGQRQRFDSFFSAVDAARQSETPANNQYDVPASAAGAAFNANWQHAHRAATALGADVRWVKGETREEFVYSVGRFTRRRFAGGEQRFAGVFVTHDRPLVGAWRGSLAARLDRWENGDGHRRELDLTTGNPVRDDRFPAESGTEFSPRLGFAGPLGTPGLRGRLAAYRAFRVPTLNEYYRPFRVGNVNTEANPALKRETVDGGEAGLDFTRSTLRLSLTGFLDELNDAVANVTLSRTPTLVSRQRRNLDALRVRGAEATVQWQAFPDVALRADFLYNDARVRTASAQPALVGTRLAQVPRTVVTAGVSWILPAGWSLEVRLRSVDTQFEDDENTLKLAAFAVLDVQFGYRVRSGLEIFGAMENATDRAIETGRSAEGLVSLDGPRRLRGGVKWAW